MLSTLIHRFSRKSGRRSNGDSSAVQPASHPGRELTFFNYWDGTKRDHTRGDIPHLVADADQTHSHFSRQELISYSRKFFDNDGIVRGAILAIARHSLPLIAQATTKNSEWNTAAEDYFKHWSTHFADIAGKRNFAQIQQQISLAIDRDGDQGVIFTRHNTETRQAALQLIESHRINSTHVQNQERWREGVRFNQYGRATHYAITLPGDEKVRVIPARSMLLLMEADRLNQRRGLPAIRYALAHFRDKKEILGYEKLSVKYLSSVLPWIQSTDGTASPEAFGTSEPDNLDPDELENASQKNPPVKNITGGDVPVLPTGQELKQLQHDRPSPTFQGFLDYLLREAAVGLGLPFEFLVNPKGITGPAQRAVLRQAHRRFEERQATLIPFIQKTWAYVIGDAITRGVLAAEKGWHKIRIQTPARITIDAGRDANQEREDFRAGLLTMQEHYGQRGLDWETELMQGAKETERLVEIAKDLANRTGLPLNTILDRLSILTPNGQPNPPAPPNEDH